MLVRLLSATVPVVEQLRQQVPGLLVSEAYPDGDPTVIFTADCENAVPAATPCRVPITAHGEDVDGMFVEVLLHVVDGYLWELELWRGDLGPFQRDIDPDTLALLVMGD